MNLFDKKTKNRKLFTRALEFVRFEEFFFFTLAYLKHN